MAKKKIIVEGNNDEITSSNRIKSQILPIIIASIIAFGAGFFVSPKTTINDSSLDANQLILNNNSKSSRITKSSGSKKNDFVSVLNVSQLPNAYEGNMLDKVATTMESRLKKLLEGTFTNECRKLVRDTFEDYLMKNLQEEYLRFEKDTIQSECKSKAPRTSSTMVAAEDIRLAYLLLVHEQPEQVIRTIEALTEPQHHFLIHVDAKSSDTFNKLSKYADTMPNVRLLPEEYRMNVSWGGYNVVQGTLNGMFQAFYELELPFHWLITVSGYTYPLMSNNDIRARLATYPTDTNFFEISPQPNKPAARTWHHFVECDNAMRRIWRLPELRNINMYAGSQWFMASREFVKYTSIAAGAGWSKQQRDTKGGSALFKDNFATKYAVYGKHTMIADENYFSTVLKYSPFCNTHENNNQVHVQFDQYEHEKPTHKALPSANKCLMPNPNHCGRSPTITTLDYLPVLDLGDKLFARKFVSKVDAQVLDAIDLLRAVDRLPGAVPPKPIPGLLPMQKTKQTKSQKMRSIAKDDDEIASCMDLNPQCRGWASIGECEKNPKYMKVQCALSCNSCPIKETQVEQEVEVEVDAVVKTIVSQKQSSSSKPPNELHNFVLAISLENDEELSVTDKFGDGWEGLLCIQAVRGQGMQGAVKLAPCNPTEQKGQVFHASPCSKDGELIHDKSLGKLTALKGTFNPPFCNVHGESQRMCLDVEREQVKEGSKIITWPCHHTKWNQLFSFDGEGSIFINIPYIHHLDKMMCLQASTKRSGDIRLAPCARNQSMQKFFFFDADSVPTSSH